MFLFRMYMFMFAYCRAVVVGWGHTNGDPWTQQEESDFATGGTSASSLQQLVDLPIIARDQVRDLSIIARHQVRDLPIIARDQVRDLHIIARDQVRDMPIRVDRFSFFYEF